MEKLLHNRLIEYLNEQNYLYKHQYGFRERSSTTIAAVELTWKLQEWLDKGKIPTAVFIDVSKAFDTIDHDILLKKLDMMGIRQNTFELLKDYLQNRKHLTELDGVKSSIECVTCGVPQGGVLAALLYIIYVNDIGSLKLNGLILSFADDTVILYEQYDPVKIQEDLNVISDYFRLNILSVNVLKTNYIVFHSQQSSQSSNDLTPLYINSTPIEKVSVTKYLGLHIDESLTWSTHIDKTCSELAKIVGVLYKLKNKLPKSTLETIYFSLFQSKILYLISIWGNAKKIYKKPLQVLQNRALKNVYSLPILYSTSHLYIINARRMLPLQLLYEKSLITFMYQVTTQIIHNTTAV